MARLEEIYFQQAAVHPLLPDKELRRLMWHARRGCREAREQVIAGNLRLVVSIARYYCGKGMSFLDLIQAGNVGLILAVDRFKLSRRCRFSTYATWWIKQTIRRSLQDDVALIRVPTYLHDAIRCPESAKAPHHVERARKALGTHTGALTEAIVSPAQGVHEALEAQETRQGTRELVGSLPEREALILRLRFGLEDGEKWTLGEVGELIGLSRERVRQIQNRALRKLREG